MPPKGHWLDAARHQASRFVRRLKQMVLESKHIPDLAGAGNLILTDSGIIRLVDINNITRVRFDDTIHLDEKGYPVCDKSIEALAAIETKLLGRPIDPADPLYSRFLDTTRRQAVAAREHAFWERQRPA